MYGVKEITQEQEIVEVLGELVQAYEMAYVSKIGRTRDSVLATRTFVDGLREMFNQVKYAHRKEVEQMIKKKARARTWLLQKVKKPAVAVLLSSSRRLSGEINQKVFSAFWDYIQAHPDCDVVVIGDWAKDVFVQRAGGRNFQYFDLPDAQLDAEQLKPVWDMLIDYEEVRVFRGKYMSLVTQVEQVDNLGGEMWQEGDDAVEKPQGDLSWWKAREQDAASIGFLFEPGLKDVLDFFDKEIFASWFLQTSNEANLAQMGSRIATLEVAIDNIDKKLGILQYKRRKLLKRRKNKRQLQALAGMSFWAKR